MTKQVSDCHRADIYAVPVTCGFSRLVTGCDDCAKIGETNICSKCHNLCTPMAKEE